MAKVKSIKFAKEDRLDLYERLLKEFGLNLNARVNQLVEQDCLTLVTISSEILKTKRERENEQ